MHLCYLRVACCIYMNKGIVCLFCLFLANFENFGKMVSSVQGGKIVWCFLSTVAKLSGVFCPRWQKGVVSFVHPGKKCLVFFGSGVFCLAPNCNYCCLICYYCRFGNFCVTFISRFFHSRIIREFLNSRASIRVVGHFRGLKIGTLRISCKGRTIVFCRCNA